MHLTPDMLRQTYALLVVTPPFRGWNMPPAESVIFRVNRVRTYCALFDHVGDSFRITMSLRHCALLPTLAALTAHEMVHLYQYIADRQTDGLEHNPDFNVLARRIARVHGFDPCTVGA